MLEIMRKPCGECLFSRNRIVSAARKAEILADCERGDTHFNCHKGTMVGREIVCAGFAKKGTSKMLRLCGAFKLTVLVDEPGSP